MTTRIIAPNAAQALAEEADEIRQAIAETLELPPPPERTLTPAETDYLIALGNGTITWMEDRRFDHDYLEGQLDEESIATMLKA